MSKYSKKEVQNICLKEVSRSLSEFEFLLAFILRNKEILQDKNEDEFEAAYWILKSNIGEKKESLRKIKEDFESLFDTKTWKE